MSDGRTHWPCTSVSAARAVAQAVYSRQTEIHVEEEVINIQLEADNCRHSAAWKATNRLTGERARHEAVITANSVEHRKVLLIEHYSRVLLTTAELRTSLQRFSVTSTPDLSPCLKWRDHSVLCSWEGWNPTLGAQAVRASLNHRHGAEQALLP